MKIFFTTPPCKYGTRTYSSSRTLTGTFSTISSFSIERESKAQRQKSRSINA